MKIQMPEKVAIIIKHLKEAGFDAYAVGGCARDSVLGRIPKDWDITTSAKPEQVKALFAVESAADESGKNIQMLRDMHCHTIDTGIQHGTVTIMLDHEGFEVTTYRIDGEYEDARHPKEVVFTADLTEDLKRRDFTINAMAYNDEVGFVDEFDGLGDIQRKVIRCVGNPEDRFGEDALRMMRAVRFAAQLGFEIEENTKAAIKKLAPNLKKISAERIQVELVKTIVSPHPEELRTIYETGIADVVLPEFAQMMRTAQNNPHHRGTVGEHTIWSVQAVPADKILRLAMLFHDVAKPVTISTDEQGIDHFHGHPVRGAEMTKEILKRLKFDNDTITKVCALVQTHDDRPYPLSPRAVRRAIHRNGEEQYPNLFEVKRADTLAQSDYFQKEKLEYLDEYISIYNQIQEEEICLSLKTLAVKGADLILYGLKPGKAIGVVLKQMLLDVIDDPSLNDREVLLRRFRDGLYDTEE